MKISIFITLIFFLFSTFGCRQNSLYDNLEELTSLNVDVNDTDGDDAANPPDDDDKDDPDNPDIGFPVVADASVSFSSISDVKYIELQIVFSESMDNHSNWVIKIIEYKLDDTQSSKEIRKLDPLVNWDDDVKILSVKTEIDKYLTSTVEIKLYSYKSNNPGGTKPLYGINDGSNQYDDLNGITVEPPPIN